MSRLKANQARRERVDTITMPPFPPLMHVHGTYAFSSTHGASAWRQHQQHSTMNQFSSAIQHSSIRSNPAVLPFHKGPSQYLSSTKRFIIHLKSTCTLSFQIKMQQHLQNKMQHRGQRGRVYRNFLEIPSLHKNWHQTNSNFG